MSRRNPRRRRARRCCSRRYGICWRRNSRGRATISVVIARASGRSSKHGPLGFATTVPTRSRRRLLDARFRGHDEGGTVALQAPHVPEPFMIAPAVVPNAPSLIDALRAQARAAPDSGIVEVMNYGRAREGVIPLWAGEGDMPTPAFAAGETFYTWQRGIPELRAALARYHARLYGREFSPEQFFVTGSGMQSIPIALAITARH